MEKINITIIGAGIVGLAIARIISKQFQDIIVVEKNRNFGEEISSRNSEVIHSGIYYPPDSLKSKTCIQGKEFLYRYCEKNNIAFKKLGKLLVAEDDKEAEKIESIYENATQADIKNLKILEREDIQKLQPGIKAKLAVFSPDSGILDSHRFMKTLYNEAKSGGVIFSFCSEVIGIEKKFDNYALTIKDADGEFFTFLSKVVINSAGLSSDRIAKMAGIDEYRIYYCKGQYFRIRNPQKFNIEHLIYPPPTEISLGIHITPDVAGGLRLGPDAEYVNEIDYRVNEEDSEKFYSAIGKFLPSLKLKDIMPDIAGIRPKLQKEGEGFKDFVIKEESQKGLFGFINLIGIESPGLTASLSIAEEVKKLIKMLTL